MTNEYTDILLDIIMTCLTVGLATITIAFVIGVVRHGFKL